jgi:hypothetical protein
MKTLNALAPLAALVVLLFFPSAASAISIVSIGLEPDTQSIGVGDAVSVDLVFSDLEGEVVSAYDLDILYDPTVLQATEVVFTTQLGDELLFEVLNSSDLTSAGVVDLAQLSLLTDDQLFAIQGGDGLTAATLSFQAVGAGTTDLGFRFDEFNDVKGRNNEILNLADTGAAVTVESPSGQAPIPEPSGAVLFALGALLVGPALGGRSQRAS